MNKIQVIACHLKLNKKRSINNRIRMLIVLVLVIIFNKKKISFCLNNNRKIHKNIFKKSLLKNMFKEVNSKNKKELLRMMNELNQFY